MLSLLLSRPRDLLQNFVCRSRTTRDVRRCSSSGKGQLFTALFTTAAVKFTGALRTLDKRQMAAVVFCSWYGYRGRARRTDGNAR